MTAAPARPPITLGDRQSLSLALLAELAITASTVPAEEEEEEEGEGGGGARYEDALIVAWLTCCRRESRDSGVVVAVVVAPAAVASRGSGDDDEGRDEGAPFCCCCCSAATASRSVTRSRSTAPALSPSHSGSDTAYCFDRAQSSLAGGSGGSEGRVGDAVDADGDGEAVSVLSAAATVARVIKHASKEKSKRDAVNDRRRRREKRCIVTSAQVPP